MKHLLNYFHFPQNFIFIALVTLLIGACSEDEDNSELLIGEWLGTRLEISECEDEAENNEEELLCEGNSCYLLTIQEDGTYSFQQGFVTQSGTWSGSISLCRVNEDEEICEDYSTVVSNTGLILTSTSQETGCSTSYTFLRQE